MKQRLINEMLDVADTVMKKCRHGRHLYQSCSWCDRVEMPIVSAIGWDKQNTRVGRWPIERRFSAHLRRAQRRHNQFTEEGRREIYRWMLSVAARVRDKRDREWFADQLILEGRYWKESDGEMLRRG